MTVLAHAFGARYDLPFPLLLFVLGGGLVVVVSFLLLSPRLASRDGEATALDNGPSLIETPIARSMSPWGLVGLAAVAFLIVAGFVGSQEIAENVDPTAFWILAWIVVPLTCGLLGDWTRPINPFTFLAALTDRPRLRAAVLGGSPPLPWPTRLGYWPAALLFFAAACGELVFNATMTQPRNIALMLLLYALLNLFAGLLFGQDWSARGEMFSVLLATWGRLGYFRFGAAGRRGFGGGLDATFESSPSRITFVLLMLVSVNFDGLLGTPSWSHLVTRAKLSSSSARLETFQLATFLVLVVVIAVMFGAFAVGSARAARRVVRPSQGLAELLPSLLPIAFGYLLVHNLQYVLINTQLMAPLIGNPVGQDWWPLHLPYPFNDNYEVNRSFLPNSFFWYVGVAVIIAVHVIAVVIAHRHLARVEPRRSIASGRGAIGRRSEYPWLVAMVAYTMVSLWLIAQPLVKEGASAKPTDAMRSSVVTNPS